MKRRIVLVITLVLTVLVASLLAVRYWNNQRSNQTDYWILKISPSDGEISAGIVTPNGTVYVPLNQSGIDVTAMATGINGFDGWVLDGKTVNNSNSTIFIPKQHANSIHTLEAEFSFGTPIAMFSYTISTQSLGVTNIEGYTGAFGNVSQGSTLQVNLTFSSIMTKQPIVIPIENLVVTYYNSTVNYHSWITYNDNFSLIQAEAFNYSFSVNPIILQPSMSNSTILTINLANDAPLGQYSTDIRSSEISDNYFHESYTTSFYLGIIITPKAT
jgi:hypothetical protein